MKMDFREELFKKATSILRMTGIKAAVVSEQCGFEDDHGMLDAIIMRAGYMIDGPDTDSLLDALLDNSDELSTTSSTKEVSKKKYMYAMLLMEAFKIGMAGGFYSGNELSEEFVDRIKEVIFTMESDDLMTKYVPIRAHDLNTISGSFCSSLVDEAIRLDESFSDDKETTDSLFEVTFLAGICAGRSLSMDVASMDDGNYYSMESRKKKSGTFRSVSSKKKKRR